MLRSRARLIPLFLLIIAGPISADCSDEGYETQLTGSTTPSISDVLSDASIDANSPGSENWKEVHCGTGSGDLQKVGLGVGHPVDPQRTVGTWSTNGDRVIYTYTGLTPYSWTLWWDENNDQGDTYCWENPNNGETVATGNTGTIPCI
jgi:hypothetical protein